MPDALFDRDTIVRSLNEVAAILDEVGAQQAILVVVGGSYLALHGLRESTADVDSIRPIEESLRRAVERVAAERHGFSPNWINDRAVPFSPAGLTLEDSDVLFEHLGYERTGLHPELCSR